MNKHYLKEKRGFTLVEMIVSLGLFTIIMFVATSAFLSIVNTDRKARTIRIAADNLNIALEDISRRIKTGTAYYCDGGVGTAINATNDTCTLGGTSIAFTDQFGVRTSYKKVGTSIERETFGGSSLQVTSPEIIINTLKFIVSGSSAFSSGNYAQPMVIISIDGSLGSGPIGSGFKIQTTVTQRAYDN